MLHSIPLYILYETPSLIVKVSVQIPLILSILKSDGAQMVLRTRRKAEKPIEVGIVVNGDRHGESRHSAAQLLAAAFVP